MFDYQTDSKDVLPSATVALILSNPVVSEVSDASGTPVVISRFDDDVWDFWPQIKGAHITNGRKKIDWTKIPSQFAMACKVVMYFYWKKGRDNVEKPSCQTIVESAKSARFFFEYLVELNVADVQSIAPIHVTNYVHKCRNDLKLGGSAVIHRLLIIDLLYQFRNDLDEALAFDPWPGASIEIASGASEEKREIRGISQTELIPLQDLKVIFEYAEGLINEGIEHIASGTLHLKDARYLRLLRTAGFFVLGLLTGMRYSELVSINVGSTRTEVKGGTTFRYVQAFETKTKKGLVDYLLPSYGLEVVEFLEKMSEPFRREKKRQYEIAKTDPAFGEVELMRIKVDVENNGDRIFLCSGSYKKERSRISIPCNSRLNQDLKDLAKAAGSDWRLRAHQTRRTFAWIFARHKLGNLLFLKEQMHHSSLSMTQMYSSSPNIDENLLNDIESELASAKAELVRGWLDGGRLAGGAGRRIEIMRNNTFENRKQLIDETSEKISIRSTGHAWCLSQDEGCGGAGLYERTRCSECKNGVIDDNFSHVWKEAYLHLNELSSEAEDMGPAAVQRVSRDLLRAKGVLERLGIHTFRTEKA